MNSASPEVPELLASVSCMSSFSKNLTGLFLINGYIYSQVNHTLDRIAKAVSAHFHIPQLETTEVEQVGSIHIDPEVAGVQFLLQSSGKRIDRKRVVW